MALQVYLIRHGRTQWNEQRRLQGWGDSPLVEAGIIGAKRTGQALADIPFSACYSSLMKRAQDTADYIIGDRDILHLHHKGLNELNFGEWEGRLADELREHPEYQQLSENPKDYQAIDNKGETIEQFYQRVTKTFEQIIARHTTNEHDENILIVSHGLTLTLLTAVINGVHWHDFRNPEKHRFTENTAINIVRVEKGKMELIEFNNTDHLK